MATVQTDIRQSPRFFWQGLLILLPVAALGVMGLFSLRKDNALAKAEVRDQAEAAADLLVPAIQEAFDPRLTMPAGTVISAEQFEGEVRQFQSARAPSAGAEPSVSSASQDDFRLLIVNSSGELIYPPPSTPAPAPQPLNPLALTASQSNVWTEAVAAQFVMRDSAKAASYYDRFFTLHPPRNFAAQAIYEAGIAWAGRGQMAEARQHFQQLADQFPEELSEGGLPLRSLALLQLVKIQPQAGDQDRLGAQLVLHPNVLSQPMLAMAEGVGGTVKEMQADAQSGEGLETSWLRLWKNHEARRRTWEELQHEFRTQGRETAVCFWSKNGNWLAWQFKCKGSGNWVIGAESAEVLASKAQVIFEKSARGPRNWPGLLAATLEIAGRPLPTSGHLTPTNTSDVAVVLAQREFDLGHVGSVPETRRPVVPASPNSFRLRVFLTDSTSLSARSQQRTLLFGSLVGAASISALVGFFVTRKAFYWQLHLSRMKSDFVSSVSHELRAPISAMRLMAEGLEEGIVQKPEKLRQYFRFISQECRRLSCLIENVLDLSRIEEGRRSYNLELSDLAALTRQTVGLMQNYAAEKGIEISCSMNNGAVPVQLDERAMQQALINLIDNAIKHSPKGGKVKVGVEVGREKDEVPSPKSASQKLESRIKHHASRACLWVQDQGEGIASSEQEKIFERFYRVGSELERRTQGVGIGLSLVKHIAEGHGGKVSVQSEVGKGSRFTIDLPMDYHGTNTDH